MPNAAFDLTGKVAIVTGGSRGIGEAIAHALAAQGAEVIICSRKIEGLEPVAAAINEAGGKCTPIACHTGKMEMIDALFKEVQDRFGRVDILVNNAATNPHFGPCVSIDEGAYDKTFEVNVKGVFFLSQKAATIMAAQDGGGAIINIASINGLSPAPMQGVYSITKAAVIHMTKTFAKELGAANVRVNCVCPGLVETKFAQTLIDSPEMHQWFVDRTPMARHAQPNEIAGAVVYLASEAASYTTGAVITVDGGNTC